MLADRLRDPFAWLAALTAFLAGYIAYQQYRTARAKLRLDLFERRFRVFDSLNAFLGAAVREADVKVEELLRYSADTHTAAFLFDADLVKYLKEVHTRGVRLRVLNATLHESGLPIGPERNAAAEEERQLLDWFTGQFDEGQKRFTKYLDFRKVY